MSLWRCGIVAAPASRRATQQMHRLRQKSETPPIRKLKRKCAFRVRSEGIGKPAARRALLSSADVEPERRSSTGSPGPRGRAEACRSSFHKGTTAESPSNPVNVFALRCP